MCSVWVREVVGEHPLPPRCLTPSLTLYFVQLWSWVTGPLCDASDPKPVYCLKSLPLSATPTSTSHQRHTATLLSLASGGWQIILCCLNGAETLWGPWSRPCSLPCLIREGIPHPGIVQWTWLALHLPPNHKSYSLYLCVYQIYAEKINTVWTWCWQIGWKYEHQPQWKEVGIYHQENGYCFISVLVCVCYIPVAWNDMPECVCLRICFCVFAYLLHELVCAWMCAALCVCVLTT